MKSLQPSYVIKTNLNQTLPVIQLFQQPGPANMQPMMPESQSRVWLLPLRAAAAAARDDLRAGAAVVAAVAVEEAVSIACCCRCAVAFAVIVLLFLLL